MKSVAILALFLGVPATAHAATLVSFTGNTNGVLATGSASISLNAGGNVITGTLTNTSPNDARITGFAFDIGPGNLAGFTGSPNPITTPAGVNFSFEDGDLGTVPQFSAVELDFGYLTGANFSGGSPNDGLDNAQTLGFMPAARHFYLRAQQAAVGFDEVLTPRLVDRQARWQAQFGRDFDFWLPNASEMKTLTDRIRAVSQQRLDQLSR